MSDSHAQIFFGIVLENQNGQPQVTPWKKAGFPYEKDWWAKIKGFKATSEINDGPGAFDRYYNELRAWFEQNPMPFEVILLGSDRITYTALGIPGFGHIAFHNEPRDFDPSKLVVTPEAVSALKHFLQEQGIDQEPRWHLGCRAY